MYTSQKARGVQTLGRAMDAEITALLVDDQVRVVCARPSGAT